MTKQEMNTVVLDKLDNIIDELFSDLHRDFNTKSGDITPQQMHELNDAIFKLSKIMTEQIYHNLNIPKKYLLPIGNMEHESDDIHELKEILFDFMLGEGYDDFTENIVSFNQLTDKQRDLIGYNNIESGYVHFFGECFILEIN